MRKIVLLIVLMTGLVVGVRAQVVLEKVAARQATFKPFLSSEKALLHMDLMRQYELGSTDTLLFFRIGLQERGREKVGVIRGLSLFDLHPAWHFARQYRVFQKRGQVVLTGSAFEEVFACANNVFSYVRDADRRDDPRFFIVSCEAAGITIGGAYDADNLEGERTSFYWKIGDEGARFSMSEQSFGEVIRDFRELILQWQAIAPADVSAR